MPNMTQTIISSWHVTPTRSGRVIFDKTNPTFPLKKLYQQARETILRRDQETGELAEPDGDDVQMFDIVSLGETEAVQNGDEGQFFDIFVGPIDQESAPLPPRSSPSPPSPHH